MLSNTIRLSAGNSLKIVLFDHFSHTPISRGIPGRTSEYLKNQRLNISKKVKYILAKGDSINHESYLLMPQHFQSHLLQEISSEVCVECGFVINIYLFFNNTHKL